MDTNPDREALIAQLTLEEKAALCSGSGFWHTRAVERVGIGSIMVTDGPHGLRKQSASQTDHVGIGGSEPATCFPTAAALASTWDTDLVERVGAALGNEAIAAQVSVLLGPGVNIKRSPLCGRNFEYFSEDPFLAGELGAAFVNGVQGSGVGTSLKHFAANNQETDRLRVSAEVDARTLREIYLLAFERVVRTARPSTVMCSYNRINGVYASQDPWLLTEVLRDEWGFEGLVVSDWGAVNDPVAAVAAGLDLEMPSTGGASAARLVNAVRGGDLDEAVLDVAVGRLLALVAHTEPRPTEHSPQLLADHHELAREAAAAGTVLLKNTAGLLPLSVGDGARVAVIGEFARTPRYQGAGSSKVNPTRLDDAVGALRASLEPTVKVDFAAGFTVAGTEAEATDDQVLLDEALSLAADSDAVLVFVGLPAPDESEGYDREHIDLPENQVALLSKLAAARSDVVVVLSNGGVVATAAWDAHASAIVECWLGGQAGGAAVADVLLGRVNPSGRLPETIPLALADNPSFGNFPGEDRSVRYGEGIFVGYRHYDAVSRRVAYPFGHGLSYTTFGYSDLTVDAVGAPERAIFAAAEPLDVGGPLVSVSFVVTNTGERTGAEVPQLYVGCPAQSAPRPLRELKAFAKVTLDPGESCRVAFTICARDLTRWSSRAGAWVLDGGTYAIAVGASSRDLRLVGEVEVDAPPPALPLDSTSTLGEWLADPVGHDVLVEALRTNPVGDLTPLLADAEGLKLLSSFPVGRLANFFGPDFTLPEI